MINLKNIQTELHWQLAFLAAQHAEHKPAWLTYDTPDGDVTMKVIKQRKTVTVERV